MVDLKSKKTLAVDLGIARWGMDRPITRRDFLNGMAVGVGRALANPWICEFLLSPQTLPQPLLKIAGAITLQRSPECGEVIPHRLEPHTLAARRNVLGQGCQAGRDWRGIRSGGGWGRHRLASRRHYFYRKPAGTIRSHSDSG